ncbi:cya [Symbiodinium microadriaticum]|nr:cya [Symbiodinium microadriaticum]
MGIDGVAESVSSTNSNFSKAGRVVRTVRLARLVRIYKIQAERNRLKRLEEEQMELVRQGLLSYSAIEKSRSLNQDRNSKVGGELSDTTTRRVIIIVLLMLCLVPVLNFSESDNMQHFSSRTLHQYNLYGDNASKVVAVDEFLWHFKKLNGKPYAIKLEVSPPLPGYNSSVIVQKKHYLNRLRSSAITKELFKAKVNGVIHETKVWFNNQAVVEEVALNGILLTIFVSVVMLTGTVVFTSDVERLVLTPIQRMMNMVEQVSKDPLSPLYFDHADGSGEYETRLLEGTIEKITSLLRVGFGQAGVRMYAIFGFCDIHHFEDVNEKLGKDIMTFVNTIAAVVHSYVHDWKGQSNKNLGQAFLLVWRIGDEQTLMDVLSNRRDVNQIPGVSAKASLAKKKAAQIDLRRVPGVDALADMALIAYCKIIVEINRSKAILAYRQDARLTLNDTHEFKVRMGFGLHAGWAIEGAVGSLQKVDATYLSPHVNMAARLESSSKQYGVPILVSQNFFDLMTDEGKSRCRRLDVITVKGSEVPIGIYTYDALQDRRFKTKRGKKEKEKDKDRRIDSIQPIFYTSESDTFEVFERDYDMRALCAHVTPEFLEAFRTGLELYLQGDWLIARDHLEKADSLMAQVPNMKGDGPSQTLLRYMDAHGWQAPSSWKGFRPLTSK